MTKRKIIIRSKFRNYTVSFIDALKQQLKKIVKNNQAHFIIDQNIWEAYQEFFSGANSSLSCKIFTPLESHKTLKDVFDYTRFLLNNKVQKNHKIVVIGGGLIQDIGSFTSHIILRGIEWIFLPTTLLSMADSCIGSKSGININQFKNQVGSFHPPSEIYIYSKFLKTLPSQEILNGIGEIIKHVLIKGEKLLSFIKKNLKHLPQEQKITEKIIYKSLLVKKKIVEEDEFEKGKRKLLNYGHTFGHALEGFSKNKIPHGIAVTIGMDMANFISVKRGLLPKKEFKEISDFLKNYIPYRHIKMNNIEKYMEFLSRDKKVVGDSVNAILCRGIGKIEILKIKIDYQLQSEILTYFQKFNSI